MAVNAKPASDNYVKISDIANAANAAALASITTVVASICAHSLVNNVDTPGAELSGSSVNLTVVASEPDAYEGFIPSTVVMVHGTKYFLKVVTTGVIGVTSRKLTEYHLFVADHARPRAFSV